MKNWWNQIRLAWNRQWCENRQEVRQIVSSLRQGIKQTNYDKDPLTITDKKLVASILDETDRFNRNNISRTKAYLDFYRQNPEIHWALLAHCVSRNGGWGMTDTYGEWFIRMASRNDTYWFFSFLDRMNWLIFHDAYPQLLLYQAGKRRNQNLSYLIPAFDVSTFMEPLWNHYWKSQNAALLTRALIINEQNCVESRVIQNPDYKAKVVTRIQFQIQSWLNLNQILIPHKQGSRIHFVGTTMRHFSSVENRICTGLCLYQGLYQDSEIHKAIVDFMCNQPHTGSRSDYWPKIFTSEKTDALSKPYRPRFVETEQAKMKIYSPYLEEVCPIIEHKKPEAGNWFKDLQHVIYLFAEVAIQPRDITDTYVRSIQMTEKLIQIREKAQSIFTD